MATRYYTHYHLTPVGWVNENRKVNNADGNPPENSVLTVVLKTTESDGGRGKESKSNYVEAIGVDSKTIIKLLHEHPLPNEFNLFRVTVESITSELNAK